MTGYELLDIASLHVGETYVLGARAPMNNENWRSPWDCAEFTSWCVYQVSQRLYGCDRTMGNPALADAFTGFWARDAVRIGVRISVAEAVATPGAALLRVPVAHRIGHVAFSDGRGRTLEAKSASTGVVRGTASQRPWSYGVLVPWLQYERLAPVPIAPPPFAFRLRDPLMRGPQILDIQIALRDHGIDPDRPDGEFGLLTDAAVRAFQMREGVTPDGIVGPETARHLGLT